ncbi:cupin domain-containing protein [Rudaea sp.]|uniref:cupin domain-containing protein n=1 Tax=Rudaea sp. TaxID=2136325 RepID=UPI00321FA772
MKHYCLVSIAVLLAMTTARVPAAEKQMRLTPAEIGALPAAGNGAGTSGVATLRTVVLAGNPSAPGLYAIEIAIPPHTIIRTHRHRDDRVATVVSGVWYLGYGNARAANAIKELPAGSFYTEPADVAHFASTRELPAVVHISGYGPSDTVYVDVTDDPARREHRGD